MPYPTCELEGWSVIHVIVADVAVIPLAATALIIGIDTAVESVKFTEVVVPAEFVDRTA